MPGIRPSDVCSSSPNAGGRGFALITKTSGKKSVFDLWASGTDLELPSRFFFVPEGEGGFPEIRVYDKRQIGEKNVRAN